MSLLASKHHLGRETSHQFWDRDLEPKLTIVSGEEVSLLLRDGSNGQITKSTDPSQLHDLDFTQMDPLTGPIHVQGAKPGDAISVEILDISIGSWGWSGILPNFGLLSDIFSGPLLKIWDTTSDHIEIANGLRFDLQPMLGVIGVAPELPGKYSSVVPTRAGGNIDVKYARVGSKILLPVLTNGALLSLGDAHALQGDGELSGTAIECEADVVIKVELVRNANLKAPIIEAMESMKSANERYRIFLGVGPDLWEAARQASLQATEAVARALKINEDEAYGLLGIIAELRIHEIVDKPNWIIGCMVPSRIFS